MNNKLKYTLPLFAIAIITTAIVLLNSIYVLSEKEAGVIVQFGQVSGQASNGLNLKLPISSIQKFDITTQKSTTEADAATKDQQSVTATVSVNYRIDSSKVGELYRTVKDDKYLKNDIVPPIIEESIKSVTAEYSAAELLSKRSDLKLKLQDILDKRLSQYFLIIETVNFENFEYSNAYNTAIEQKAIQEQEVQKKKLELEKAKADAEIAKTKAESEAQIKLIEAEAEAESIIKRTQALKDNPEIIELEKIKKWNGQLPKVTSESGTIIDLQ